MLGCASATKRLEWSSIPPPRWLTAAIDAKPPERRDLSEQPLLSRCQRRFQGKIRPGKM